jgi:hypothetical protein
VEQKESFLRGLGRRLVAWTVLAVALILALKIAGAIVIGFVTTILTIAAVLVIGVAVIWALRRI